MIQLIGLITPVIVPLVVSGMLFLGSEKNNRPKLFLAFYMMVISFVFLANYFYFKHIYEIYIWLHSLHIATVLFIYPGIYIYLHLLIHESLSARVLAKHLLPIALFFFLSLIIFTFFLSKADKLYFLEEYRFHPDFSKFWLKLLFYIRMANIAVLFIQVFVYLFLINQLIINHRNEVRELFSNPEKFQLNWVRLFNIALALAAFITVFIYAANPVKLFGDGRFLSYPLFIISIILWFLGIMGNNQPAIGKPETRILSDKELVLVPDLASRLVEVFNLQKPYLNPELKIWDLCSELGTNRTYLSNTINKTFNMNFASFVNKYRAQESKNLLNLQPEMSASDLALKSGFGSINSMNRVLKEVYKQTFKELKSKSQILEIS